MVQFLFGNIFRVLSIKNIQKVEKVANFRVLQSPRRVEKSGGSKKVEGA